MTSLLLTAIHLPSPLVQYETKKLALERGQLMGLESKVKGGKQINAGTIFVCTPDKIT